MTAATEHLEREVKLGVWPGFRMPDLDGVLEGLVATPVGEQHLDATYVDTPDLRLARTGITLRHRSGEGWTLKLPDGAAKADGVLARRELTVPSDEPAVPPELARLVTAWVRGSPLGPVARLQTLRRRVLLTGSDGVAWGEVVDDEVSVLERGDAALRFREVEVELGGGAPAELLDQLVSHLRAAGAGPADPIPKAKRALGPRAFEPAELTERSSEGDGSAASVIRQVLRSSVRRLLEHDFGARLGDVEGVHQARVATRRLRSDLRTFGPLLDDGWATGLRAELKWLAAALGEVRDADVLLDRLRAAAAPLGAADVEGAAALLGRLEAERSAARGRLLAVLDDPRYVLLLDQLVASVEVPTGEEVDWLLEDAKGSAADVLPRLVARPWKRFRKAARAAGPGATAEELHQVRIRAKRCRYAAEAAAPAGGKHASKLAKAVAEVQDVLGEHQDAVVAQAWLRATAPGLDAAEALVAGQLIAGQRAAAEASRQAWPKARKKADRRKLRAWLTT